MQALTSPAITELTTESGTYLLLDEWLGQWFDGGTRSLGFGGPAVVWPVASRQFGPGPVSAQPLDGVEIRVIQHPRSEGAASVDTVLYTGKLVTATVTLAFWVRAKVPGKGQSQRLARTVAELLKALVTNPDPRAPLAQRGLCHLQPLGPATAMPSPDYAFRVLMVTAQVQYAVTFGEDLANWQEGSLAEWLGVRGSPPTLVAAPGQWRAKHAADGSVVRQTYNPNTGKWHTVGVSGDPAQVVWDRDGES